MTRKEIYEYVRVLADELTESPEGLFTDVQLKNLINISQRNVQSELLVFMPWYFRDSKTATLTSSKREYAIATDFSITDCMLIEEIIPLDATLGARPFLHLEPREIWLHGGKGTTGIPRAWGYESSDEIFFEPTPNATILNGIKIFYIKRIPDLNSDETHTPPSLIAIPSLPEETHQLLALDVLRQWYVRDGSQLAEINERFNKILQSAVYQLSSPGQVKNAELTKALNKEEEKS